MPYLIGNNYAFDTDNIESVENSLEGLVIDFKNGSTARIGHNEKDYEPFRKILFSPVSAGHVLASEYSAKLDLISDTQNKVTETIIENDILRLRYTLEENRYQNAKLKELIETIESKGYGAYLALKREQEQRNMQENFGQVPYISGNKLN